MRNYCHPWLTTEHPPTLTVNRYVTPSGAVDLLDLGLGGMLGLCSWRLVVFVCVCFCVFVLEFLCVYEPWTVIVTWSAPR